MALQWSEQFANPSHRGASDWSGRSGGGGSGAADGGGCPWGGSSQVIFTSSATEANHLTIRGLCEQHLGHGRRLVTVAMEHATVLSPASTWSGWDLR